MTAVQRLGFGDNKAIRQREIMDDLLSVSLLLDRLREARLADETPDHEALNAIELAAACLQRARTVPRLEEKWSCLNKANAVLAYACKTRDEQRACMLRLRNLAPLLSKFKDRLPEPFSSFDPDSVDLGRFSRWRAFEMLATASQGWHLVNEQNAFSTLFWQRAALIVLALLLVCVAGMESYLFGRGDGLASGSYIWAMLFGGFGGAISILLQNRNSLVSATTFRVTMSQGLMRLLLGGVGAFIVILAIDSDLVFRPEIKAGIAANFGALALTAIAAGFSERLFLSALERVAGTLEQAQRGAGGTSRTAAAAGTRRTDETGETLAELAEAARMQDLDDEQEQMRPAENDVLAELERRAAALDDDDAAEQQRG